MKRIWPILALVLACNPLLVRIVHHRINEIPMPGNLTKIDFASRDSALRDNARIDHWRYSPIGVTDARPQRMVDAQAGSSEAPPAESILPEDQPADELYYDDTWRGYAGASANRQGSLWSVLLTLALSILTTLAGYWLFGRK